MTGTMAKSRSSWPGTAKIARLPCYSGQDGLGLCRARIYQPARRAIHILDGQSLRLGVYRAACLDTTRAEAGVCCRGWGLKSR